MIEIQPFVPRISSDASWPDRVRHTLKKIRERAKLIGEPKDITLAKLEAVRNHCQDNGDFAQCRIGNTVRFIKIA